MFVALKPLSVVQTKPTIKTVKHLTQFLNYSTPHPEVVTKYRIIGRIIHVYSYVFYISEPEAQSRAGEYFFLGPKSNTLIQSIPPEYSLVHVECIIIRNVMASAAET